jgi:hypothetical protein
MIEYESLFQSSHELFCPITSFTLEVTDDLGNVLTTESAQINSGSVAISDTGEGFSNRLIYIEASTGNATFKALLADLTVHVLKIELPNIPPKFLGEIPSRMQLAYGEKLTYELPEVFDGNGDDFSIELGTNYPNNITLDG